MKTIDQLLLCLREVFGTRSTKDRSGPSLDAIVECADRFHDAVTAVRLGSVTVLDEELRNAIAAKELGLEAFLLHCSHALAAGGRKDTR
jgi:hypothetical protein